MLKFAAVLIALVPLVILTILALAGPPSYAFLTSATYPTTAVAHTLATGATGGCLATGNSGGCLALGK